jgi:hypothetical protein
VELDTYLAEQSQQGRWSGSVFVSRNGQTVLDRAYGIADRETGQPNTPQTAYQIASVSKQFRYQISRRWMRSISAALREKLSGRLASAILLCYTTGL